MERNYQGSILGQAISKAEQRAAQVPVAPAWSFHSLLCGVSSTPVASRWYSQWRWWIVDLGTGRLVRSVPDNVITADGVLAYSRCE